MDSRSHNSTILTQMYYKDKEYDKCLQFVRQCINIDPAHWYYYLIYGFCLRDVYGYQSKNAANQFEIGWKLNPSDATIRFVYANQLFYSHQTEKAAHIHKYFFDQNYKLKSSTPNQYATDICVQLAEVFLYKISQRESIRINKITKRYKMLTHQNKKTERLIMKKYDQKIMKRIKYLKIAKILLNQGMKYVAYDTVMGHSFSFAYTTRRFVYADIIDMNWMGAFNKIQKIIALPQQRIPEDYDDFIPVLFRLKKYDIAGKMIKEWIKEQYVLCDDSKLLTVYCHLMLLYCRNGNINKCESLIEKAKDICLKLCDKEEVKRNYVHSSVFHFHMVYGYYLTMNDSIHPETASDAFFIIIMQNIAGKGSDLWHRMGLYFGNYLHYKRKNYHLARFFYVICIMKMDLEKKEIVYYHFSKLLYKMGEYKLSLQYWEKSKNLYRKSFGIDYHRCRIAVQTQIKQYPYYPHTMT